MRTLLAERLIPVINYIKYDGDPEIKDFRMELSAFSRQRSAQITEVMCHSLIADR